MPSILDGLSDAQREAVTHRGGPLLLSGAPGTGKTRCVSARARWLIEQGADASSVLVLSGSRAGAERIRGRLEEALREGHEELAVFTPLALCVRVLRAQALRAGLDPFFVPATRADRIATLLGRLDELTLARHDLGARPAALMASLVERIDALKEDLIDAEAYAASVVEGTEEQRELAQLYLDHDRMLAERGTPDAGELLIRTCGLLREDGPVRAALAAEWRWLLVDDFQYASPATATLVRLMATEHRELTVAAEAPTGAAVEDFLAHFPEARRVSLTQSLRCPPRIMRAVAAAAGLAVEPAAEPRAEGEVVFW
ncbi:MAG TPA: UvrD-helicase domain-containing protein, partial [Solirubrobacteraceae bacterium]|nr:UvrD-helicase domain-containing protein [Solirubrobacteraceae bacterium]